MKNTSLLASCKLVTGDRRSEGNRTAKVGTDEQKPYTRLYVVGKATQHANAYNQRLHIVDMAEIDRKKMLLPGDISPSTGWQR